MLSCKIADSLGNFDAVKIATVSYLKFGSFEKLNCFARCQGGYFFRGTKTRTKIQMDTIGTWNS